MASDPAHARSAGKEAVGARTVWFVDIGPLRARCLLDGEGYVVQARTSRGWTDTIGRGADALELLRRLMSSAGMAKAMAASVASVAKETT